ncbi:MAG: glycosyltransferase [Candidatus Dactylopiibacterium sp.]|nr:glycosyltransferase [Candidatus Dactylopiibacterium sp.]
MAHIVFISPFPLFPATGGNRVRTLHMLHALETLGHAVHFALMPSRRMGDFDEAAHRQALGARFSLLERGGAREALYLLRRAARRLWRKFARAPLRMASVDETYFGGFTRQLRALDRAVGFDAAVVQYVSFSGAFEAFGARTAKIIDTHDSLAGQMPAAEERRGLLRADRIIAIQDREAELFRALIAPEGARVVTISHLIEARASLPLWPCEGAAFIGSDFEQNNESLTWFIRAVLPRIRAQAPDFTLRVAGSVGRAVPDAPGVRKLGVVADPAEAFAGAPILVNCITRGTGVKIKLLEAFGAGLPVVSTTCGVAGIAVPYLRGTCVCPDGDAESFAAATLALYESAALRERLAAANLAVAREWNAAQHAALARLFQPGAG